MVLLEGLASRDTNCAVFVAFVDGYGTQRDPSDAMISRIRAAGIPARKASESIRGKPDLGAADAATRLRLALWYPHAMNEQTEPAGRSGPDPEARRWQLQALSRRKSEFLEALRAAARIYQSVPKDQRRFLYSDTAVTTILRSLGFTEGKTEPVSKKGRGGAKKHARGHDAALSD